METKVLHDKMFSYMHVLEGKCLNLVFEPFRTQSRIFTTLQKTPVESTLGKRRKCWKPNFFSFFLLCFSTVRNKILFFSHIFLFVNPWFFFCRMVVVLGLYTAKVISWRSIINAHVFPGFFTPVLRQLPFQGQQLFFTHASSEVRGENTIFYFAEDRPF